MCRANVSRVRSQMGVVVNHGVVSGQRMRQEETVNAGRSVFINTFGNVVRNTAAVRQWYPARSVHQANDNVLRERE